MPLGKSEKARGVMKDELGGKIIKTFVRLRPKRYSHSKDNNGECKKAKGTKKCLVKRTLKFQDHKNCLTTIQIIEITAKI